MKGAILIMNSCGCNPKHDQMPAAAVCLAIASIPIQPWETPCNPETALKRGTAFPSLDLPFYIGGEKNA